LFLIPNHAFFCFSNANPSVKFTRNQEIHLKQENGQINQFALFGKEIGARVFFLFSDKIAEIPTKTSRASPL